MFDNFPHPCATLFKGCQNETRSPAIDKIAAAYKPTKTIENSTKGWRYSTTLDLNALTIFQPHASGLLTPLVSKNPWIFYRILCPMAGEEELASHATVEIMMALQPPVLILLLIGAGPHVKLLHVPPLCII